MKRKSRPSWCGFDLPGKKTKLKELETQAEDPSIWDNPQEAQKLMKSIALIRQRIESWESLSQRLSDTRELAEMDDESIRPELETEAAELEKLVLQKELNTLLSGKYDRGDALLTINAGAGGTDSQDWSAMLQRMYLRWAERRGFDTEVIDMTVM